MYVEEMKMVNTDVFLVPNIVYILQTISFMLTNTKIFIAVTHPSSPLKILQMLGLHNV